MHISLIDGHENWGINTHLDLLERHIPLLGHGIDLQQLLRLAHFGRHEHLHHLAKAMPHTEAKGQVQTSLHPCRIPDCSRRMHVAVGYLLKHQANHLLWIIDCIPAEFREGPWNGIRTLVLQRPLLTQLFRFLLSYRSWNMNKHLFSAVEISLLASRYLCRPSTNNCITHATHLRCLLCPSGSLDGLVLRMWPVHKRRSTAFPTPPYCPRPMEPSLLAKVSRSSAQWNHNSL